MSNIAVITTFPNEMFDVYAKKMLESFVQYWPKDVPLIVQLDNNDINQSLAPILRKDCDIVMVGRKVDHQDFIDRNKDKEDPQNYRKQPVRFCHKVFAIQNALDLVEKAKSDGVKDLPRYLIWLDADVHTTKPVSHDELKECLPKEGDAVAYLGRKDWPHSECGWLAFDLENGGADIIKTWHLQYITDAILQMKEWHDSWVFDQIEFTNKTNLTADKPGMEIWPHSPMGKWSTHYKGPMAKQQLLQQNQIMPRLNNGSNIQIQTKNSLPDEVLRAQIEENQKLIKNWVRECLPNDERVVVVSAGPHFVAEDVLKEVEAGRKIFAVKHSLTRLKNAGITPYACILLDPRPHVADFVKDADPNVLWIVASQVNPQVTKTLLERGCTIWGYHASVGAGEHVLTEKQPDAIISGGSATATRGMYLLEHLGFRKFKLYGYELSFPDKPDLNAKDEIGQPKYLEFSVSLNHPLHPMKKTFFSEPQLMAQFEEFRIIVESGKWDIEAEGEGIVPFLVNARKIANLRHNQLKYKISKAHPVHYEKLFKWKTKSLPKIKRIRKFLTL
jgi:hypothetical protein